MTIIGIDPGATKNKEGGIAVIQNNEMIMVAPMPTIKNPSTKAATMMDGQEVARIIREFHADAGDRLHVIIEQQSSRSYPNKKTGQTRSNTKAVQSTFKAYGILVGICLALEIAYEEPRPQEWQGVMLKGMPKGDTKASSVVVARQLFPKIIFKTGKRRSYHDGMTDAALIATYGMRLHQGEVFRRKAGAK